jgi:hypothetical protein
LEMTRTASKAVELQNQMEAAQKLQ